jgi:uncharacterized membrane protein YeaQ/YmgE (transglycosylase-associated protein family)
MFVLGVFVALLAAFVILPLVGVFVWFLVSTAITGIILGGLASLIIPGRQPIGILATVVSGWVGSLVGGAIGTGVWGYHHHRLGTLLIEVGVSALTVLAWSAGSRHGAVEGAKQHHVIDI